jgi:hypothetical protein
MILKNHSAMIVAHQERGTQKNPEPRASFPRRRESIFQLYKEHLRKFRQEGENPGLEQRSRPGDQRLLIVK